MKLIRVLIASCLLASIAGCASKPIASEKWPKHECGPIPEVDMATYCYDESRSEATDVMFWMPGLGDTANVWKEPDTNSDYPELIEKLPPTKIVTISFAQPVKILDFDFQSGWMITGYPNRTLKPAQATLEVFKTKIVPFIEAKYGIKGPYKIAGHSQGSSNAAMLVAAFPEMWSKVVLLNPAMITDQHDPWDLRTGEYCPWCYMVKSNYDNLPQWKSGGPNPVKNMPPTLVTACPIDIFGLYAGAESYVVKSRKLGNKVTLLQDPPICTHWRFPVDKVVKFLAAP